MELDLHVGHRIHAQRFGSPTAPLVVGVHGLTLNMRAFDALGEWLGGDDLQLVAIDLRGRGTSDATPPGTYGWANHAADVFAVADALGVDRFAVAGQSMGGSVAMKAAELDGSRLEAVVLLDIAGRVDPGVGPAIASFVEATGQVRASVDEHLDAIRAEGLVEPWDERWERCFRYGLVEDPDGRVRPRARPEAIAEDRAHGLAQDVYARWAHLTMPTLLVRATRELRPGAGHVVPADDRDAFLRHVLHASVVEVDANHLTVNAHPDTAEAVGRFLRAATA